jgi:cytochrome c oxidase assembly factor CtaG
MSLEVRLISASWTPPPLFSAGIVLTAGIYLRGWFAIRRTRAALFTRMRLLSFVLGLITIWLSVASPLDGFADVMLSAHMVEHLLLMSVAPPLLLMGYPSVPLLRGLPGWFVEHCLAFLIKRQSLRTFGHFLVTPPVAWLLMNLVFLGWHIPWAYDFALEHEDWHVFEHACFLGSSIIFWWPIIRAWPTKRRAWGWYLLPYLAGADIINTALSAFLAFCDRPVYTFYLRQSNPFHLAPQSDQALGAVIMWVFGSSIFLIPVVLITAKLLRRDPVLDRLVESTPCSARFMK